MLTPKFDIITETDQILGSIWSDLCIKKFNDAFISEDGFICLCSDGVALGSTSFEILEQLGAQA